MIKKKFFLKKDCYGLLAGLITSLLLIAIFSLGNKMFFSEFNIMKSDLQGMYVPIYKLFVNKVFVENDIFTKGKLFYSSLPGMGMDMSAYVSCLSVLNPINIVFYFFEDNIACIIVIIVKLSLAAFFFQKLIKKLTGLGGLDSIFFSIFYPFCGYCSVYYFNVHFLDGVYLLPFIIERIYSLFVLNHRTKKDVILTYLSFFLLFTGSFYSAYIVGIFSFIFFVFLIFAYEFDFDIGKIVFLRFMRIVIFSIFSALFVLLPAARYILVNRASDSTGFDSKTASLINILDNFYIGKVQGISEVIPYLYSGLAILLLAILFFVTKEIDIKIKIMWGGVLIFLFLCCKVPFLYLLMHCFDAPDQCAYRFSYIISFCLIIMASYTYSYAKSYNKLSIIFCGIGLIIGSVFIFFIRNHIEKQSLFILVCNIIFIVLYIFLFLFKYKFSILNKIIYLLLICEVALNAYLIIINTDYEISSNKDIYNAYYSQLDDATSKIRSEDHNLYRVHLNNIININDSLLFNEMNSQLFGSFESERYRKTQKKLGFATSPRVTSDYGFTDITKMLFGYKYDVDSFGIYFNSSMVDPVIEKNSYALPLGYLVSTDCDEILLSDDNPFINQNLIVSEFTGEKIDYFKINESGIDVQLENVSSELLENGYTYLSLEDESRDGIALYSVDSVEDNVYLYIPQDESVMYLKTPVVYSLRGGDDGNYAFQSFVSTPHILELGRDENNFYSFYFYIGTDMVRHSTFYKDILIYNADNNKLEEIYENLNTNAFIIDEFIDGYIKGTVNCAENKRKLFLSIPYDKNWTLMVDGKPEKIDSVIDGTFMICLLPTGQHSIVLEYRNRYFELGCIFSIIGLMLIFIDVFRMSRNKNSVYEKF